eukprot:COSAG03_NODE_1089_length_4848_cov_3.105706_1_plen_101_part_10
MFSRSDAVVFALTCGEIEKITQLDQPTLILLGSKVCQLSLTLLGAFTPLQLSNESKTNPILRYNIGLGWREAVRLRYRDRMWPAMLEVLQSGVQSIDRSVS